MHTHFRQARGWLAIAAIVVLIAAHVLPFAMLARADGWLALALGIVGIAALKFAWWKFGVGFDRVR